MHSLSGRIGRNLSQVDYPFNLIETRMITSASTRSMKHRKSAEDPFDIEHQHQAIREVLSWPQGEYVEQQNRLLTAARQCQNWDALRTGIRSAVAELQETQANAR